MPKKAEAVALAKKADTVLLCLGLDEIKESEGLDRADMKLADNQIKLLQAVQQANPNTVVIVSAGASLETPWLAHCRALVYGALGGQAGAGAMVDVLTGKINPSGKLAETWANTHADTPAKDNFAGAGRTVQYREGLYVGYRYYQTAGVPVAFPFGYGLSYTSFAYSELKADARSVTLTVTNTGSRAGAEIVQVYAAKLDAQIFRPAQELKAFTKVWLEAGESKTVTLPLDDKAFRYWNTKTDSWEVEGGTYELRVGANSADIRLTAAVEVNGTSAPNPYAGKALPHYTSGKVQRVPDDEWEILLGRPIPADTVKIDRNMTLGELNHSRSPLCWLVWAVLTMMLNASYKRGKPNLNVMFQYNMPLRALAKMTSGAISMGMVDGIVLEAKGFWVIGLLKVIVEAVKKHHPQRAAGKPPAQQLTGRCWHASLEYLCGKASCRSQVGARGWLVRRRVEFDYCVQVPAAAIFAQGVCRPAGGRFRLAGHPGDALWRDVSVEHSGLRCRPRRSAVLLRVYDRHGHRRVHQFPDPAQFCVPQQGKPGQADRVVRAGVLHHHLHRQLHQLCVGGGGRAAGAGLHLQHWHHRPERRHLDGDLLLRKQNHLPGRGG